jgi:O-antigen/teichoic acid export membrane protein
MQEPTATTAPPGGAGRLVVRNILYLGGSQVVTLPLSVLVSAMMARYLGPADFGFIYLAATLVSFGSLIVDWGHQGALPALIARDRSVAGPMLGTSLMWRGGIAIFVYAGLAVGSHLLGYGTEFQWALGLTFIGSLLTSWIAACKDTIRGFERADIPAYGHVAQQLIWTALIIPALMLGGGVRTALIVSAISMLVVLFPMWRTLKPVGVGALKFSRDALRSLMSEGTPFVLFALAMILQPNIDALFLSKLAPPEVMGWYAASRRLIGMLLLPSSALIGALYPTLCRLWIEDKRSFNEVVSNSLRGTTLIVVPVALGCALYPRIGVSIFSTETFGPAEDNLRILALFLVLVYFSMPIGTALLAAGFKRAWTIVQVLCVLTSLVLDPLLIPWFQKRMGNGGAGLCLASVASELLVVVAGVALMPRGVFDRRLLRSGLMSLLSGGAMVPVALATRSLNPFLSAPLAIIAYGIALFATGAIDKEQLSKIRGIVERKFPRLARTFDRR